MNEKSLEKEVGLLQIEISNLRNKAYALLDAIPQSTLLVLDDAHKRLKKLHDLLSDFNYCYEHYNKLIGTLSNLDPEKIKESAKIISLLVEGLLSAKQEEEC